MSWPWSRRSPGNGRSRTRRRRGRAVRFEARGHRRAIHQLLEITLALGEARNTNGEPARCAVSFRWRFGRQSALAQLRNDNLAKLADGRKVRFLNVNDQLADEGGKLREGMMNPDKLHPALKGYQVWADGLKPLLRELLGPPKQEDHAPAPTGDPSARP